ncbi:MAG: glycosyltransferase family 39 protein [Myxococcota bacterium]|nr:glycosyltransferase family 39 protein [Myxococcota bacterium]
MATGITGDSSWSAPANAKWLALGLTAIGFALRCLGYLDAWPNPDEGAYYAIATSSSWSAFASEIAHHPHPPGIYVLHRLLGQAGELGTSLAWLRLPSLLGGSAAIYGIFLLGRELGGDRVGLLSAAMLALSPAAITLSQVLRPYGLLAAALVFGAAFLLDYARSGRTASALLAGIALSCGLMIHYSTFLLLPAACAIVLHEAFVSRARGSATPLALLGVWAAISLWLGLTHVMPALAGEAIQQGAQASWLADSFHSSPVEAVLAVPDLFRLGAGSPLAWAALATCGFGFVEVVRQRSWPALALSAGTLLVAMNAAWLGFYPFGSSRHNFYLVLLLAPVAALGIDSLLARGRSGVGLLATTLALSIGIAIARPTAPPLEERLATRAEFEESLSILEAAREQTGLWLLDRQTYRFLTPYFGRAGEMRERNAGHAGLFTWFDWGAARVVVAAPWRIRNGRQEVGRRNHVFGALLRASSVEGIETSRHQRGLLILGGWNLRTAGDDEPTALVIRPIDWVDYIARTQPLARGETSSTQPGSGSLRP